MKILLLLVLLPATFLYHSGNAAGLPADSSQVTLRIPDHEKISELKAGKEFSYLKTTGGSYSWWERFWIWLGRQITLILQSGEGGNFWSFILTRIIPWALVLAAAVLVAAKVFGLDLDSFLTKKQVRVNVPFREETGDIRQIDFDTRIHEALRQRNFRLAIRMYYLDALQRLSGAGLVQWHPEKTNRHYFTEIGNPEIRNRFGSLTALFEYVWYGEFELPEAHFEKARSEFLGLKELISRS